MSRYSRNFAESKSPFTSWNPPTASSDQLFSFAGFGAFCAPADVLLSLFGSAVAGAGVCSAGVCPAGASAADGASAAEEDLPHTTTQHAIRKRRLAQWNARA